MRVSVGASMPGQAVELLLLLVVLFLCTGPQSAQHVHLGGAINLFSRYGYLSISMRVVPRNDTDTTWIFREPTVDVFRNTSLQREPLVVQANNPGAFQGDFHLEFCDNMKQLLQAYFREFSFERLDRPWRAFSASWSRTALARHIGIDSSFAIGAHSYVLVRVTRHRDIGRLKPLRPDVEVEEVVAEEADKVKIGDSASVIEFVRSFGSHYISSYITGNSLYQVFVYSPTIYRRLKERLKNHGVSDLSHTELSSFFSPWYAEHIGIIQAASGNTSVQAWATENLRMNFYFFTYTSLLKLHGDGALLRTLDKFLGNEALVQLNLKMLSPVFKDPVKRRWFEEVVDNYLKLWEVNM